MSSGISQQPPGASRNEGSVSEAEQSPLARVARLSLALPIGLQLQAEAKLQLAQQDVVSLPLPVSEEPRLSARSHTPRDRLRSVCGRVRIFSPRRHLVTSRDLPPEGSSQGQSAVGLVSDRTRDGRAQLPPYSTPSSGSTANLARKLTSSLSMGFTDMMSHMPRLSRSKSAMPYHVWVHRETEETPPLTPFAFGAMAKEKLAKCGADVRLEGEASLDNCLVCIFMLSPSFFACDRSLALMRRAVAQGKQFILINMPGAKYHSSRLAGAIDADCSLFAFPENSFNPAWQPFCPDLKPAFSEICITWELEYSHASVADLIKRVGGHLARHPMARAKFHQTRGCTEQAEAEDDALREAAQAVPSEVELEWDWETKKYDVFLSHKITDAKDIVLTWYNALSALGYHPFLDRLSLDSVEKIPDYVKETATFVITLTRNLFESYWCAVELCTAALLHEEGSINVLIVPVQGEQWPGGLSFPTPAIVTARFSTWFPRLPASTRAAVERLYGGGQYTQTRLIKHTLIHYKSFERLLVARIGPSIARRIEIATVIASGGATVASQVAVVELLLAEANAYSTALGASSRFELLLQKGPKTAMGYTASRANKFDELSVSQVRVSEVLGGVNMADYSVDEFVTIARALRDRCSMPLQSVLVRLNIAVEQWQLVQYSASTLSVEAISELTSDMGTALKPLADTSLLLISYAQIISSLLLALPRIEWPEPFANLARLLGLLSLDLSPLFSLEAIGASVGDAMHGAAVTVLLSAALLALLLSLPVAFHLIAIVRRPEAELREAFYDRCIQLAVGVSFVLYPVLCGRLLLLFHHAEFNDVQVLSTDVRLSAEQARVWQLAATPFVLLYVVGIPLTFAAILRWAVRPALLDTHGHANATATLQWERRCHVRFSLLYAKYTRQRYWYEVVELPRKLILTGVLTFVASGTAAQIYFGVLVALLTLLMLTSFMPHADRSVNLVCWLTHMCTLLTLLCALGLHASFHDEDAFPGASTLVFASAVVVALSVLQFLPLIAVGWLTFLAFRDLRRARARRRPPPYHLLPAVLKDDPLAASRASNDDGKEDGRCWGRLAWRRNGSHRMDPTTRSSPASGEVSKSGSGMSAGGGTSISSVIGQGFYQKVTHESRGSSKVTPEVARSPRLRAWSHLTRVRAKSEQPEKDRGGSGSCLTVREKRHRRFHLPDLPHHHHHESPTTHRESRFLWDASHEQGKAEGEAEHEAEDEAEDEAEGETGDEAEGKSCQDLGLAAVSPTTQVVESRKVETRSTAVEMKAPTPSPPPPSAVFACLASSSLTRKVACGGGTIQTTQDRARALDVPLSRSATKGSLPAEMPPGWKTAHTKLAAVRAFQTAKRPPIKGRYYYI